MPSSMSMSLYLKLTGNGLKGAGQAYLDCAREKGILFDYWLSSNKAEYFAARCELMLLEDFKNRLLDRIVVYLNKQKENTLQQAASLADKFALTHRVTFNKRDPSACVFSQRPGELHVACAPMSPSVKWVSCLHLFTMSMWNLGWLPVSSL